MSVIGAFPLSDHCAMGARIDEAVDLTPVSAMEIMLANWRPICPRIFDVMSCSAIAYWFQVRFADPILR